VGIVLFLTTFASALTLSVRGSSLATVGLVVAGAATAAFALLVWGLPALAGVKAARQHHRFPEFHGELVYEFGATGLTLSTPASRLELPWSMIVHVLEDARLLYLVTRADFTYYLPKRALSEDTVAAIRDLLAAAQRETDLGRSAG
jgi:hypothetical protein